jgi:PAS domain S-box-containing protein
MAVKGRIVMEPFQLLSSEQTKRFEAQLQNILMTTLEVFEAEQGLIRIYEEDTKELVIRAAKGLLPEYTTPDKIRRKYGEGKCWSCVLSRNPLLSYFDDQTYIGKVPTYSLIVPLFSEDRLVGTIGLYSKTGRLFGKEYNKLFMHVGSQIGLALDNAILLKQNEWKTRSLETLWLISKAVNGSLALEAVLESALASIMDLFQCHSSHIRLVDYETKELVIAAYKGGTASDLINVIKKRRLMESSMATLAVNTGEALVIEDVETDPRCVKGGLTGNRGCRSFVLLPLYSKDKLMGTMAICFSYPRNYDPEEVELYTSMGHIIGTAIENAKLHKEKIEEIAERNRLEERLKESEVRFRRLSEAAFEAIVIHDKGVVLSANDQYFEMFGYEHTELLGKQSIPLTFASEAIEFIKDRIFTNDIKPYESTGLRKNGVKFPIKVRIRLIEYEGRQVRVDAIADITEQKQAEEELLLHRDNLEKMVKERTAELESKSLTLQELNTALKVLLQQRENDKKDMEERFIFNIRNLVLPYVEQMKNGHLAVQQKPYLDIIEGHLHEITSSFLKDLRQFNLTPRELRVASLVKDGKTTKEIAEIIGIGIGSIDTYRKNIRKKISLSRKTNLQSHLRAFDQ